MSTTVKINPILSILVITFIKSYTHKQTHSKTCLLVPGNGYAAIMKILNNLNVGDSFCVYMHILKFECYFIKIKKQVSYCQGLLYHLRIYMLKPQPHNVILRYGLKRNSILTWGHSWGI